MKAHDGLRGLGRNLLGLGPLAALAQAKELRIGVQYGLGYLPLYVARDAGLFDKHMKAQGLEPVPVRIVNFTGRAADPGRPAVAIPSTSAQAASPCC